ncbi:hypothetical protein GGR50DRAFT_260396 [Xylaria sp. CBS 124048]|nr:hypothetical protein GGR50DRAFT_260396 [Xylaria sp. CBS 124048]
MRPPTHCPGCSIVLFFFFSSSSLFFYPPTFDLLARSPALGSPINKQNTLLGQKLGYICYIYLTQYIPASALFTIPLTRHVTFRRAAT